MVAGNIVCVTARDERISDRSPHLEMALQRLLGRKGDDGNIVESSIVDLNETGERHWEADLYRIRGELLLLPGGGEGEPEECFNQGLKVAKRQSAKSLELRAAMSLARLWQKQDKTTEARELLGGIYGWFTEGFDTPDLIDAKALLEELE